MLELGSLLAFAGPDGSCLPPTDAHIHITDTLDASGQFVMLHYAFEAVQRACPVLWLSANADGHAHFSHIARKAVCTYYLYREFICLTIPDIFALWTWYPF